jgi:hypothetical protein
MFSLLKESVLNIKSKLQSITDVLETDEKNVVKKIEKKEKRIFQDSEKKIEKLKNQMIIKLNIGGKIFQTTIETLENFKNSLFYESLKNHKQDEEIFFDRPFKHFKYVLDFLRSDNINLKVIGNRQIRELVKDELIFYKLISEEELKIFQEIEIGWEPNLSKIGAFTLYSSDEKTIHINSTSCYTHFVTDRKWTDESFVIEFESNVMNIDEYFYIGLVNDNYNFTSNCMCCSPENAFYLRSNGEIKINSQNTKIDNFRFSNEKEIIGMKVDLNAKTVIFYIPNKAEYGPVNIFGNFFRVVSGSCNTSNGTLTILTCYENNLILNNKK